MVEEEHAFSHLTTLALPLPPFRPVLPSPCAPSLLAPHSPAGRHRSPQTVRSRGTAAASVGRTARAARACVAAATKPAMTACWEAQKKWCRNGERAELLVDLVRGILLWRGTWIAHASQPARLQALQHVVLTEVRAAGPLATTQHHPFHGAHRAACVPLTAATAVAASTAVKATSDSPITITTVTAARTLRAAWPRARALTRQLPLCVNAAAAGRANPAAATGTRVHRREGSTPLVAAAPCEGVLGEFLLVTGRVSDNVSRGDSGCGDTKAWGEEREEKGESWGCHRTNRQQDQPMVPEEGSRRNTVKRISVASRWHLKVSGDSPFRVTF